MKVIRNSVLSTFRMECEGKEFNEYHLAPYLAFGTLVDALITEPERYDCRTHQLRHSTNYEDTVYHYDAESYELASLMRDAYFEHPLCGKLIQVGGKYPFDIPDFKFEWEGQTFQVPTGGELDVYAGMLQMAGDVKVTSEVTKEGFFKKVDELYYDQQGAFYMDNHGIDFFVISGISRKRSEKNGLPTILNYCIERGSKEYQKGRDRYSMWSYRYLEHHGLLDECRV